jgi:lactoylglutathione lyase
MTNIKLIVLRCRDIEASKAFYECFDMKFKKHSHGDGPKHYAFVDGHKNAFELYPSTSVNLKDQTVLGFAVFPLEETHSLMQERGYGPEEIRKTEFGRSFVVRDPDQRRIEVIYDHGIPF